MGNYHSSSSKDLTELKNDQLIKTLINNCNNENEFLFFQCITEIKHRKININQCYKTTIPFIILSSKMKNKSKYAFLQKLLTKCLLDLNEPIGGCGNLIVHCVQYNLSQDIYQLLFDYGADINSAKIDNNELITALDYLPFHNINLIPFFRDRGAYYGYEMMPENGIDEIIQNHIKHFIQHNCKK